MLIGFAGNVNNYPLSLALACQRAGHETVFISDSRERLHFPSSRYPSISPGVDSWCSEDLVSHDRLWRVWKWSAVARQTRESFKACDALVLNRMWALLGPMMRKPYVIVLTGSDAELYADYKSMQESQVPFRKQLSVAGKLANVGVSAMLTYRLRKSIRQADGFTAVAKGLMPRTDRVLTGIAPKGRRLVGVMTDVTDIKPTPVPCHNPMRVLNAARISFGKVIRPDRSELDVKRTDILLHGIAELVKNNPDCARLTLVEKGDDIRDALQLIEALGIQENVEWRREMSQQELFAAYQSHDVVCDQLGPSIVSMAGLDAMAHGRPLVANERPEIMRDILGVPSAVFQARSAREVTKQLGTLLDPEMRLHAGRQARAYVEQCYSTDAVAARVLGVLESH